MNLKQPIPAIIAIFKLHSAREAFSGTINLKKHSASQRLDGFIIHPCRSGEMQTFIFVILIANCFNKNARTACDLFLA